MRVAVLGGMGIQGRAALADLTHSSDVQEAICADLDTRGLDQLAPVVDLQRLRAISIDASSKKAILSVLRQGVDVAIDLLPFPLMRNAFEAAIEAGVPLVSTNYGKTVRDLHGPALEAGVALMPECGLDPGIDLVLYGRSLRQFDTLEVLDSYCGGFPERSACDNPLFYKISWNWDMVLGAQMRDAVLIADGQRQAIPCQDVHRNRFIHSIDFPGLGQLEAFPNGDAVFYTDLLGITASVKRTGRYTLRWPGWCALWQPLKQLGFLSLDPVPGLPGQISPRQFLSKMLGPHLQYADTEKDLVVMHNVFQGRKDGRNKTVVTDLFIERDLKSGLLAMSIGVGYPASVVAQMLARREITKKGLLSPVTDIPSEPFFRELAARGVQLTEKVIIEDQLGRA